MDCFRVVQNPSVALASPSFTTAILAADFLARYSDARLRGLLTKPYDASNGKLARQTACDTGSPEGSTAAGSGHISRPAYVTGTDPYRACYCRRMNHRVRSQLSISCIIRDRCRSTSKHGLCWRSPSLRADRRCSRECGGEPRPLVRVAGFRKIV
jgi:hypothetical protein